MMESYEFVWLDLSKLPEKSEPVKKEPEFRDWDIWMEGYQVTGESQTAHKLATYRATSFENAVKHYMIDHPGSVERRGDSYTIWACQLFDNEEDARKSFG